MNNVLKIFHVIFQIVFSIACSLTFSVLVHAQTNAEKFAGLENLIGEWKFENAESNNEKSFRLKYHLISNDSALVEVYGNPAKQTTETVFHRDGANLLATHYCARGNQPRLNAIRSSAKNNVEFTFKDITNLKDQNDPHMVRMKFTFIDNNHFQKEEVYLVNGKEESSTMTLIRVN